MLFCWSIKAKASIYPMCDSAARVTEKRTVNNHQFIDQVRCEILSDFKPSICQQTNQVLTLNKEVNKSQSFCKEMYIKESRRISR